MNCIGCFCTLIALSAGLAVAQTNDPVLTPQEAEEVDALNQLARSARAVGLANPNAEKDKIEIIRQETLEESLRLLPLDGLEFYLPSLLVIDPSTAVVVPPESKSYADDVVQILYNRRFRKALAEIQQRKPEEVTPLVVSSLREAKKLFDQLYAMSVVERPHLFANSASEEAAALGAQTWRDPSMEPTLCAARLGLFSLLLLAANVPGGDAAPFVASLSVEARDSRDHFYKEESGNLRARLYAVLSGPYNPIILGSATLLLAGPDEVLSPVGLRPTSLRLNRFDVLGTSPFASDNDTGSISLTMLQECSDTQFDALTKNLESRLASGAAPGN